MPAWASSAAMARLPDTLRATFRRLGAWSGKRMDRRIRVASGRTLRVTRSAANTATVDDPSTAPHHSTRLTVDVGAGIIAPTAMPTTTDTTSGSAKARVRRAAARTGWERH